MIFVGIDPGVSGGIAVLNGDGHVLHAKKMPEGHRDLQDVLREARTFDDLRQVTAVVERVAAFAPPGMRMGATSAFTFGYGVGSIHASLTAVGIPFELVAPAVWQKFMGCRTKGDKNISKRKAQDLFPTIKVTHALADALLLAEFWRRRWLSKDAEPQVVEVTAAELAGRSSRPIPVKKAKRVVAETDDF